MNPPQASGRPSSTRRVPQNDAPSWASTPAVRGRMQRQATRDTAPELALRRLLHALGLRYRVDAAPIPGLRRRADLVFGPARVAVFVDGCFWHGCPNHGTRSTHANPGYWAAKVAGNRARDEDTDERLRSAGWLSVRVWEHERPEDAAERIAELVRMRRAPKSRVQNRTHPRGQRQGAPFQTLLGWADYGTR
jgi:DNA mismatch endonuclease (patch repair protein)